MSHRNILPVIALLALVSIALFVARGGAPDSSNPASYSGAGRERQAQDVDGKLSLPESEAPTPLSYPSPGEDGAGNEESESEQLQPDLPEASMLVEVVYRDGGNPVFDAYVKASSTDSTSHEVIGEETARTNMAGLCDLTLPLGTLSVTVWTDAHEYGRGSIQHNGGGGLEKIRIEIEPLTTVSGVVIDAYGQPIAGARVSNIMSDAIGGQPTTTDQQGRFEFHDWRVGPVAVLSVRADGYGQGGATLVVNEDARWSVIGMSGDREWRGDTGAFVEIVLERDRVIRGALVSASGEPVANGTVRASGVADLSSMISLGDEVEAGTDSEGVFELRGLRADVAHLVMCAAPGEGVAVRATEDRVNSIDLGTIPLSGSGRVAGRFVDRWDRPISGALLELSFSDVAGLVPGGVEKESFFGSPGRLVSRGEVSKDGRFEVDGPSVNGLQLAVMLGVRTLWKQPVDLSGGNLDLGTVRIETEVLPMRGRLVGLDDGSKYPARLEVVTANGNLWARVECDVSGAFQFVILPNALRSVTLVRRSEDGYPINRWTSAVEMFPVALRVN